MIKTIKRFIQQQPKKSYSQSGEDLIIDFLFRNLLRIKAPKYIDIGAHHPTYLSNTHLFYKNGAKGIVIEPDPVLFKRFLHRRKRDICLNVGISNESKKDATYYVMSSKTLNTFCKEEALLYTQNKAYGEQIIEKTINVPLIEINSLLEKYFDKYNDFISLDVEGLDTKILKQWNFNQYRPKVFCIETVRYNNENQLIKIAEINEIMKNNKYILYADTFINSIFLSQECWESI